MIIIVRHGQTLWNILKKKQGHKNSKLTSKGKIQGVKVANFFNQKINNLEEFKIYSSPLKRVVDYINIINKKMKKQNIKKMIIFSNQLREHKFGKWEGKTIHEIKKIFPKEFKKREMNKWNYKVPNGDSYAIIAKRLKKFLKNNINLKKNYIIFTHEMVSKILRGILLNLSNEKIINSKHNSNNIFIYNNKKIKKIKLSNH